MPDKPQTQQSIVFREEGEEAFLFNSETGDIKVLNSTAAFIWKLCDGKHPLEDIINKIADHFEVASKDKVTKDLNRFLTDLSKSNFIRLR